MKKTFKYISILCAMVFCLTCTVTSFAHNVPYGEEAFQAYGAGLLQYLQDIGKGSTTIQIYRNKINNGREVFVEYIEGDKNRRTLVENFEEAHPEYLVFDNPEPTPTPTPEPEDPEDPEDPENGEIEERINAITQRLEEFEYTVDEDHQQLIKNSEDIEELGDLLNEKLDITILGLEDLIDGNIELLANYNENSASQLQMLTEIYVTLNSIDEHLDNIEQDTSNELDRIRQETVSGNTLISDFDDHITENLNLLSAETIEQFNTTLMRTNYFLSLIFWIAVIGLAFALAVIIVRLWAKVFYNKLM